MSPRKKAINLHTPSLHEHVDKLSCINSEKYLINYCSNIAKDLDTSYFSYRLMWSDSFHSNHYKKITNCKRTMLSEIGKESNFQKVIAQQETILLEGVNSYECDACAGIIVPIPGFYNVLGAFELNITPHLNITNPKKHLEAITPCITCLGGFVQQAMIRLLKLNDLNSRKQLLTRREKECLCWAADGKTASETASCLCVSEYTIKFHLKNIKKKLGARNTAQSLALAILKGHITPEL